MADFVETIRATLSGENEKRNAAEASFTEAKKTAPAQTVVSLFGIIQEPSLEQPLREQGAVLLRQCLSKVTDEGSIWLQLGEAGQVDVKMKTLQMLEAEQIPSVRKKVADMIQSLANQLIAIEDKERPNNVKEWPDLMPTLMRIICDGSKDAGVRADCLWTVKEMACTLWPVLISNPSQTVQVLRGAFADASEAVRANGACLLLELSESVETSQDRAAFMVLAGEVGTVITQLADGNDPKQLSAVLEVMQSGSEIGDFFKDHIASFILPVMCTIAKSHKDDEVRRYAFETLLTLGESKPKAVAKIPQFLTEAFAVCVQFLMETNDDVDGWAAEEDEDADEEEHFTYGKDAVDRLCRCMHKIERFPLALEHLKPIITELFQTGEWKKVVAGVSIVAQIAEYVDDEVTVLQMMGAVQAQLGAAHPRVRYSAWSGMAQFAEDHAEIITTDKQAAIILPLFVAAMEDPCERVALRSMESFQHYGESVEREDLEPFVQTMMEKLGAKIQKDVRSQKKAITFIAVIAGQIEDSFASYYPQLMPVLKQIIERSLHQVEERQLLGKCFECISLLAKSIGRAGFKADAEQIMQAMLQAISVPNLPEDDPVKEYMMAASERICHTMKEDFLPFVQHILPGVLEKLKLTPREFSPENVAQFGEGAEVNLTVVQEGGKAKVLVMSTSEMEDLKNGLECIHTFVEELGKLFLPFVATTAQALLPVFDFSMAEEIRDLAFETWGQLCSACRKADSEGGAVLSELTNEFLKRILPKFEENDVDVQAFKTRADGVTTCLRKAGPNVLKSEEIKHVANTAMKVLGESYQRREQIIADMLKKGKNADEEEGDGDDDDEVQLRIALMEIAGALMQHHPDLFVADCLPNYLELVQKLIVKTALIEDRKLAFFVACDFLEHLGPRVTAHWPGFLPQLLEDIVNENAELRHPACYGASLAAANPAFAPMAAEVAAKLAELISSTRAQAKKKSGKPAQAAADNALSALIELLLKHQPALAGGEAALWNCWFSALPCQEDEQEGTKNHKILLQLVKEEKKEVLGEGGQNLPAILRVLVDVYKTDMADEETCVGIGQLTVALGQARLEASAGDFSEKHKKKLLRIHREATEGAK